MLSPIFHPASDNWYLVKIENNIARPLSKDELDAHLAEFERLKAFKASHKQTQDFAGNFTPPKP